MRPVRQPMSVLVLLAAAASAFSCRPLTSSERPAGTWVDPIYADGIVGRFIENGDWHGLAGDSITIAADGTGERRWRSYFVQRGTTDTVSALYVQEFELRRHDTGWRAEPPGTAGDWFFDAQFFGDMARVNGSWFRRVD